MTDQVKVYKDFFSKKEIDQISDLCYSIGTNLDYYGDSGVIKNDLIGKFNLLTDVDAPLIYNLLGRLRSLFNKEIKVIEVMYTCLYNSWDVHTDFTRQNTVGFIPAGNFCIPLDDINSRTIMFDQRGDYTEFFKYRDLHAPIENCITEEFWDEHLDHCWPTDRRYLSHSGELLPYQRKGQLIYIPRDLFHSSDNFHKKCPVPKRFLQVLVDYYV